MAACAPQPHSLLSDQQEADEGKYAHSPAWRIDSLSAALQQTDDGWGAAVQQTVAGDGNSEVHLWNASKLHVRVAAAQQTQTTCS
eukprot:1143499-Pelagomonas_calceolata.AAC.3